MFSLGSSSVFLYDIQPVTPSTFPWSKDGTLRRWCVVIREYSLPTWLQCHAEWRESNTQLVINTFFNPSTCTQMVTSRKHTALPYLHIYTTWQQHLRESTYVVSHSVNHFRSHLVRPHNIHAKCSKARKQVWLLYRQFQGDTDPATLFNL